MAKLGLPCDDSPEVNQRLIIDTVANLHDKITQMHSKINELNGEIHGLKGEASVMGLHERLLQERLDAVIEVIGDESLVDRMVDDIDRWEEYEAPETIEGKLRFVLTPKKYHDGNVYDVAVLESADD